MAKGGLGNDVRLLLATFNTAKDLKFQISSGKVWMLLECRFKYCKLARFPIEVGTDCKLFE